MTPARLPQAQPPINHYIVDIEHTPKNICRFSKAGSSPLFLSQKTDAAGEGATFIIAEHKKVGSIDIVVDVSKVSVPGNVVEATTNRPIITERVEALFDVRVQCEPGGKPVRSRRLN